MIYVIVTCVLYNLNICTRASILYYIICSNYSLVYKYVYIHSHTALYYNKQFIFKLFLTQPEEKIACEYTCGLSAVINNGRHSSLNPEQ